MKDYKIILFDLDGTLSDPKIGITKCVQYALSKMDIYEENLDDLEHFIGPPLQDSFSHHYSFKEDQVQTAIQHYRDRFKETGMFENALYEQIPELLQELKDRNYILAVATSKPTVFSEQILTHFQIHHFFNLIVGSNLDGTRTAKTEIIQHILDHYNQYSREDFVMIGDRKHDIIGAHNTEIDSIGVTYGYGSEEEIKKADPTFVVEDVAGLKNLLSGMKLSI